MVNIRCHCEGCVFYPLDEDRCIAFPNGIPEGIWIGEDDHRKVHKSQNNKVTRINIDEINTIDEAYAKFGMKVQDKYKTDTGHE